MKRIALFAVISCLSFVTFACAASLTCDTTTEPVDYYLLKFDGGAEIRTDAVRPIAGGGVNFLYPLDSLPVGQHTVVGKACNDWDCSVDSVPFTFEKKATPSGNILFKLIKK